MKLANMIRERISNLQGEIGVYFYDIKQDNSFFVGNCDVFPSLGIAKLVLLIEVFRQVEEKVIRLRHGLYDNRVRTLEEVGKEFNLTRERIRQIEVKALRRLSHPSRLKRLEQHRVK